MSNLPKIVSETGLALLLAERIGFVISGDFQVDIQQRWDFWSEAAAAERKQKRERVRLDFSV
jgi:hypothetical protein